MNGALPEMSTVPSSTPAQRLLQRLPGHFRNMRAQRYRGEDFDVALASLTAVDQAHIRSIYALMKDMHSRWLAMRDAPDWAALQTMLMGMLAPAFRTAASDMGLDSMTHCATESERHALGKVLHDLRGGALAPLQLYAAICEDETDPVLLRSAVLLARDQAKIMRNALPDLDPEVRAADESEKPHFIQAVVDKWDGFRFERAAAPAGQVSVQCAYEGLLASCCLEASAVDRIVYNYMNNAIRFSAGPQIRMDIVPVGDEAVRWTVANPVTKQQAEWLQRNTQGDLSSLFRGGITKGGNGLGLSNCADFVAAAFGLPHINAALEGQYLGATVEDGWYVAWAHWPSLYAQ